MKLLKSFNSMHVKRQRGMTQAEEAGAYQEFQKIDKKPTGKPDEILIFDDDPQHTFYHLAFYEEVPKGTAKKKHQYDGHFQDEIEQERYEFFCCGWIDFFDKIVAPKTATTWPDPKEHKLFFFWGRKDINGVAIYINDQRAVKNKDVEINLSYTPATATGDPPLIPPPPPPSAK